MDNSRSDPSQEILQQKADAINAVLTDEQKSSLATPRTANGNKPQGGTGTGGGTNRRQAGWERFKSTGHISTGFRLIKLISK